MHEALTDLLWAVAWTTVAPGWLLPGLVVVALMAGALYALDHLRARLLEHDERNVAIARWEVAPSRVPDPSPFDQELSAFDRDDTHEWLTTDIKTR